VVHKGPRKAGSGGFAEKIGEREVLFRIKREDVAYTKYGHSILVHTNIYFDLFWGK
jgi:hypothetical protein